jgi:uncharacterized RDD family membrane protein YckC
MQSDSPATAIAGASSHISELTPATFGQRITAGIIDFFLVAAYIFGIGKLCSSSKATAEMLIVPLALGGFLYSLIGHALYGKTIGKFILKISVVRLDGSAIGWNESLRRSSVEGIFGVVWAAGLISAVAYLPNELFKGQGWSALYKLLLPHFHRYVRSILQVYGIWPWSEFITMFFNKRRRAIHDFIGSTMVIQRSQTTVFVKFRQLNNSR